MSGSGRREHKRLNSLACFADCSRGRFREEPDLSADFQPQLSFEGIERTVCDYIAGMTDHYAVDKFEEIFIPMGWQVRG